MEPVTVRVVDPKTQEILGEATIENDYAIICAGSAYLYYSDVSGDTHTLTIKGVKRSSEELDVKKYVDGVGEV